VPRGKVRLNPERRRAWAAGKPCVWEEHGVWRLDESGQPLLLKPDYFATKPDGSPVRRRPLPRLP
jgi:hypothetical protein